MNKFRLNMTNVFFFLTLNMTNLDKKDLAIFIVTWPNFILQTQAHH